MDKELIELILMSDKINSEQKTEIIKELIKNVLHIPHYPFNDPVPNWQGPHVTPCPTSPFYYGEPITCDSSKDFEDIVKQFNKAQKIR